MPSVNGLDAQFFSEHFQSLFFAPLTLKEGPRLTEDEGPRELDAPEF